MGERVEIVTTLLEMFRRRENETPFAYYAEDIVWDTSKLPGLAGGGVYHGHDGVRDFWRGWLEAWETIEWSYEVVEEGDKVAALISDQRNLGRGSGAWVKQPPYAIVFGFRGNQVASVTLEWRDPGT